jgi:hypothetical protein
MPCSFQQPSIQYTDRNCVLIPSVCQPLIVLHKGRGSNKKGSSGLSGCEVTTEISRNCTILLAEAAAAAASFL